MSPLGALPTREVKRPARVLISIIVGLFIYFLASQTELAEPAKRMAAITGLMAALWISEAIPIAATALLPIPLYPLLNIMPAKKVTLNYGNHLLFLFLGGFMIATAIQRWDLHKRIALSVIRFVGLNPKRMVLGFMIATAFLSMWISNTATVMMMYPIAMALVLQIRDGDNNAPTGLAERFGTILMLAIAYSASVGGVATLVGTPPNIVFAGFISQQYPDAAGVSFVDWMKIALPFSVIFLAFIWWYLTHVAGKHPVDQLTGMQYQKDTVIRELAKLGAMTNPEKKVLLVACITGFLWIFRTPIHLGFISIPGWSSLFPNPAFVHDSTVAMAAGLSLFFIPCYKMRERRRLKKEVEQIAHDVADRPASKALELSLKEKDKEPRALLDWHYFEKHNSWGIILLFGGGFALAAGLQQTGLTEWLAGRLEPLRILPIFVMILAICLMMTFLTEITSNTATATIIIPILAPLATVMDVHPYLLMIPATISASCAFMLPVATPPNAIIFGSGWVTVPQMTKVGFVLNLAGAVLVASIVYLLTGLWLQV